MHDPCFIRANNVESASKNAPQHEWVGGGGGGGIGFSEIREY
jgi:hypothetical protein